MKQIQAGTAGGGYNGGVFGGTGLAAVAGGHVVAVPAVIAGGGLTMTGSAGEAGLGTDIGGGRFNGEGFNTAGPHNSAVKQLSTPH